LGGWLLKKTTYQKTKDLMTKSRVETPKGFFEGFAYASVESSISHLAGSAKARVLLPRIFCLAPELE
jgi:hypothetical protein